VFSHIGIRIPVSMVECVKPQKVSEFLLVRWNVFSHIDVRITVSKVECV